MTLKYLNENIIEKTKYIKLPFIRLIFRDGKYEGWYRP